MAQIDIPAWWGAILSTIIAVVAVVRHFLTRPRLDVEVTLKTSEDFKYPNRIERLNLKLVSDETTTIERCDIRAFEDLTWKTRLFGMRIVSSGDLGAFTLPKRLEAAGVLHGWLDARTLYEHYDRSHGRFRIEVFDTLHRRRPTKIKLKVPPDFKKTLDPRPGTVYTVVVENITEARLKTIAEGFHKAFDLRELRSSYTTGQRSAQFEFSHAESLAIDRIAKVVESGGGIMKNLTVR
jgi:hypothetical protein